MRHDRGLWAQRSPISWKPVNGCSLQAASLGDIWPALLQRLSPSLPLAVISAQTSPPLYTTSEDVLSVLPWPLIWTLLFQLCSQRCSYQLTTSFGIQLEQRDNSQLTGRLLGLLLWHFLSCALKHQFVFSRPSLQRGFDLYQSLWHVTGTRWWLSRRPQRLPPVQQMTAITPSTPLRHTSCCRLQPRLVSPPEATIRNSRSFINASSSIRWHWCLNNWTSAQENEKKKFNSFLLIHSTLVIFQPLSVCKGLRVFQWQHVKPPAVIQVNC